MAYFSFSDRFAPLSDQTENWRPQNKVNGYTAYSGMDWHFYLVKTHLLSAHMFPLGHILEHQVYVKYKYLLDEADEKGWLPLHEAVIQPIQQILEIVLDGEKT